MFFNEFKVANSFTLENSFFKKIEPQQNKSKEQSSSPSKREMRRQLSEAPTGREDSKSRQGNSSQTMRAPRFLAANASNVTAAEIYD